MFLQDLIILREHFISLGLPFISRQVFHNASFRTLEAFLIIKVSTAQELVESRELPQVWRRAIVYSLYTSASATSQWSSRYDAMLPHFTRLFGPRAALLYLRTSTLFLFLAVAHRSLSMYGNAARLPFHCWKTLTHADIHMAIYVEFTLIALAL